MDQVKPAPPRVREESQAVWYRRPGEWWRSGRTFLTEVRNELKRVTWPSRKEVTATTIVVILTSILFGLYLWGLDLLINAARDWIYRQLG